jgi:acyl carrier protein
MPPVSAPAPERGSVAPPPPPKPRNATPTRVEKPAAPVSAPSPAAKPATSEDAPSAEQFRQDLLEVVSTRTGYPIDALDEDLHLESGLGIDSIKTVEIFSKLKPYHKYFRAEGEGEEELLTEFTKMKTLRDIVNSYDRRRQDYLAKNGTAATDRSAANGVDSAVKRYEVTPVAAPLQINGSKKNYLTGNFSS